MRTAPILVAVATLSCTAPRLEIVSEPAGAPLHLDGRSARETPASVAFPYYGTLLVEVDPPESAARTSASRRAKVALRPLVSGWFFPFDFAGDALAALLGRDDRELRLDPVVDTTPPDELDDEALRAILAATKAAAQAR